MPDPAKTTSAEIRYEVRMIDGPCRFTFRSFDQNIQANESVMVIMRITVSVGLIFNETIVGVLGAEFLGLDCTREVLRMRGFLSGGGIIGISKDLL